MPPLNAFLRSFSYAWSGIIHGLSTQRNLKVQAICAGLAFVISIWLGLSPPEWAILILTLAGVMGSEMFNTALETTLDHISRERHPQIGIAKDVAAGAVLIWALASLGVALCLWVPKLYALFSLPVS
ncbi:MAG: diacylglycerol kinase [Candidatus Melainabacteria bacterium HGW-Melainabacteria-1]|nr:MAG: diacylglycerol kinase [Candidatus Melainabacteria bacterium HGW-Melainabacteria-1]